VECVEIVLKGAKLVMEPKIPKQTQGKLILGLGILTDNSDRGYMLVAHLLLEELILESVDMVLVISF
jgi:hypothetical protein